MLGRPEAARWVWRSTAGVYPALLAAGVRVERVYDVEAAEALLLGYEGRGGAPRSLSADEVIVHCPRHGADQVADAVRRAGGRAGEAVFGATPVRFCFTVAVVGCYADAKSDAARTG